MAGLSTQKELGHYDLFILGVMHFSLCQDLTLNYLDYLGFILTWDLCYSDIMVSQYLYLFA